MQFKFNFNFIKIVVSEEIQQLFIFGISLDNWCTLLTIFGVIIGAIWGLIQYDKTIRLRQQEKATAIAKSFAEKLTIKCTIVCTVIENSPLYDLIDFKGKDCFAFSNFNTSEIREIYNDDDFISKYKKVKKESNLNIIYYNILENLISTKSYNEIKKTHTSYTDEEIRNLFILNNSDLPFLFSTLVCDVLNELEYLCMQLSSQAAGSKYVYQSLHQVFLRTIRTLAIHISIANNTSYSDKYYTNIISVYNEWKNLYARDLNNEKNIKKKVDQILNPKIRTV